MPDPQSPMARRLPAASSGPQRQAAGADMVSPLHHNIQLRALAVARPQGLLPGATQCCAGDRLLHRNGQISLKQWHWKASMRLNWALLSQAVCKQYNKFETMQASNICVCVCVCFYFFSPALRESSRRDGRALRRGSRWQAPTTAGLGGDWPGRGVHQVRHGFIAVDFSCKWELKQGGRVCPLRCDCEQCRPSHDPGRSCSRPEVGRHGGCPLPGEQAQEGCSLVAKASAYLNADDDKAAAARTC